MRRLTTLIVALCLAACSRVDTAASGARHSYTRPGVLRIADIAEPDRFNPLLSTMDLVEDLASLVFSYLVIADDRGRLIGDLATEVPTLRNGGISADGVTYRYHLRDGVRWHDGKPFTARDVKFTWQLVMDKRNNVFHREGYDRVASIDTPDEQTVVVHLRERYPPFVTKFFTTLQEGSKPILPQHLLARMPVINEAAFNGAPVGTGPFTFVKWERGKGMEFAANEHYFKGRPKLDRILFSVVPDDNTVMNQMRAHEIDLAVSVGSAQYAVYRTVPGIRTQLYPWNGASVLLLNNARPGLRHVEVRRALTMALDYASLIGNVTHGVGEPALDIIAPTALGYARNAPYAYDPAGARALLEKSGWRVGTDGIRSKGGERLDFTYTYSSGGATGKVISVQMQQWFRDIGVGLTIKPSPYNVIFSYGGPIVNGRYDLASYGSTMAWDPDMSYALGCSEFAPKGENAERYCDPLVDAAEGAGLATDDPAARAAIYHRIEPRIHATVPYIVMYVLRRPTAFNDDLKGYSAAPGIAAWWNAYQWSI